MVNLPKAVSEQLDNTLAPLVSFLLGGPRGDPDFYHQQTAAILIVLLEDLGIDFGREEDEENKEFMQMLKAARIFVERAKKERPNIYSCCSDASP